MRGLQPVPDRLFRKSRLAKVTGDKFRLCLNRLSKARLDGVGYAGVKRATRLAQQRAIGRVLHQRMLE
jgi:hypothetical protein